MNDELPLKKEPPVKKALVKRVPKNKEEVKEEEVVKETELAPIVENSKYMLPKTWLSEKQVLKILQKTPPQHIYQRPGKGGGKWDYVTGNYIEKVLNYVFGWNWDFEIIKQEAIGIESGYGQIITLGKLTGKDDHGHSISKSQNGRKDVAYKKDTKIPMDLGNDYKASATDCLKKCASLFGIASDIYGKEEFKEIKAEQKKPIEADIKPTNSKLDGLFKLAQQYGAKIGEEAVFIQEHLERDIDWPSMDDKTLANLKTQLMSKLTPRQ